MSKLSSGPRYTDFALPQESTMLMMQVTVFRFKSLARRRMYILVLLKYPRWFSYGCRFVTSCSVMLLVSFMSIAYDEQLGGDMSRALSPYGYLV
jgi:hypothetical protein